MVKPIIDISSHNSGMDGAKVKENVEAVIIRLGYRGYSKGTLAYDKLYRQYRAECEKYKIPYSLYFFPCSVCDAEAEEEADFIIREAAGMNYILPVFLDSEVAEVKYGTGRADKLSRAERTRYLKIICDKMQKAGVPAGIYASASWLKNNLDVSQLPYSIWVAQWSDKLTYNGDCMLWQYSDKGAVPGISGRVDLSRRVSVSAALSGTKKMIVTGDVVNIRKGPDTSYDDIGDLAKGTVITVDKIQSGFAHFEGWTSTAYLKNNA